MAKGHALIVPKRHEANYFNLTFDEQKDLTQLSGFVQDILKTDYNTEDFTLGMNIGRDAGQRMDHATIHLIPRYPGDCANSKGGVRNILKSLPPNP